MNIQVETVLTDVCVWDVPAGIANPDIVHILRAGIREGVSV